MHVAIIGPGALGTVFAVALERAGHQVNLIGRPSPWTNAIQANGVRFQFRDGREEVLRLPVITDPSSISSAEVIIVLVKTVSTRDAVSRIATFIRPGATILTLQNGLGNASVIRSIVGESEVVLPGTTSQAAQRLLPNVVIHTGEGPTILGYESEAGKTLATKLERVFSEASIPTAVVPDIERWIWRKAAVNSAVNGLTALADTTNRDLLVTPDLFASAESVAEEAAAVARAFGFELGGMGTLLRDTLLATAENRSSMLQDLSAGRATEVDAIQGAIVQAGNKVGVATPLNALIAALIRAKSSTSQ